MKTTALFVPLYRKEEAIFLKYLYSFHGNLSRFKRK